MSDKTKIADVFDPEILSDMVSAELPTKVPAMMANIVQGNPYPEIQKGGQRLTIPRWKMASSDWQQLSETTAMATKKITTETEYGIVARRGDAFSDMDLAKIVSMQDPMVEMSRQISDAVARGIMKTHIKVLTGALGALAETNLYDATAEEVDGKKYVTPERLWNAKLKLGDNLDDIKYFMCHSMVFGKLAQTPGLVTYDVSSNPLRTGKVPFILGMEVFFTDYCPFTGTVGDDAVYTSFLLGAKSMWLGYQKQLMIETDRDILAKEDLMSYDLHFISHLDGVGYLNASTKNPADTDLETAANWELCKEDAKQVRAVALLTN